VAPTGDNVKLGTATTDGSGVTGVATTGRSPETQVLVESVFGRGGIVVAASGDYDADEVDYDNATSGLVATDVQAAVDELAARPAAGGWNDIVIKKTDQTNTTSANDNTLLISVAANKEYYVHLTMIVSPSAALTTFTFTAPASATFNGNIRGIGANTDNIIWQSEAFSGQHNSWCFVVNKDLLTTLNASSSNADTKHAYTDIYGILVTGANAGTLQLQYGAASGNHVMRKGSVLRIKDIT
jgi:hypothetical protein